ncbi:uncharacterized protein LOC106160647 isoform X2 [Lingula anatina]|nr:uncharacterized protein LOC106160647 isoform X2 [Lingula anatina]XP_013392961.1 uncharacterized protein LOC106160647 isoform X2 [Lingula anatina]|eukprot:XP_013392870.1 uncharacterized protein LOC106160647 isoform X2 [Lingula anatina]
MGGEMKKSEVGINSNKEMEVITMAKINKAVHWNPSVQSPQQPKLSQTLLQKLQNAGMHKSNSENCTSDKTGTVKKMVLQKANDRNKKHLGSLGTKSHNLSKDRHSVTVEVFVQNEDQLIKQINNAGGPKESMTTATTESGKSENIGTDKVTREGPRWTSHSNHGAIDQHLLKSEKHKQNKRSTVVASLSNQASKQGNVVNKRYIVAPSGSLSPTSERQKRTLNRLNNKQSQGHQLEKYVRPPGVYMTGPGGHYAVDTRIHKNNNTAGDPVVSSSSGGKLQNS